MAKEDGRDDSLSLKVKYQLRVSKVKKMIIKSFNNKNNKFSSTDIHFNQHTDKK